MSAIHKQPVPPVDLAIGEPKGQNNARSPANHAPRVSLRNVLINRRFADQFETEFHVGKPAAFGR
jgi:hypothetical protein